MKDLKKLIESENLPAFEITPENEEEEYTKRSPKNNLTDENIKKICYAYFGWKEVEGFSKVITTEKERRNDYNLTVPANAIGNLIELGEIEEEREEVDKELKKILRKLDFEVWKT